MGPNQLRVISTLGILIALFLCVVYLLRTYQAGETRWYFLIMAMGIGLMLTFGLFSKKRKK